MNQTFRARFYRLFRWGIGAFALLLVLRLLYGYFESSRSKDGSTFGEDYFSSIQNLRKNYASEQKQMKIANAPTPEALNNNSQKYERIAALKTQSSQFDADKQRLEIQTKQFKATIQYEKNEGKQGNRELHLLIGVTPALFDSFYLAAQKIGTLRATEITKIDQTNEFRQLNAQKVSLQKTLTSLNELQSRGGAISDFIGLHDKILEIEGKMQALGVELGNFDSENEFCTVRFSMYEGRSAKSISFIYRLKVALEWTLQYYTLLVFALASLSVLVFLLLLIIEKLNVFAMMNDKNASA
jgi:Domain of unknown function (DUF4349)